MKVTAKERIYSSSAGRDMEPGESFEMSDLPGDLVEINNLVALGKIVKAEGSEPAPEPDPIPQPIPEPAPAPEPAPEQPPAPAQPDPNPRVNPGPMTAQDNPSLVRTP